jgi:2-keto-4-pentenoate hydratase
MSQLGAIIQESRMSFSADDAATYLFEAHREGARFVALEGSRAPVDMAAAYDVQDVFIRRLIDAGIGAVVGYKIGLTSVRMQQMCRIDQPIAGRILASRLHHGDLDVCLADFGRLGIEFEVGTRLGKDLDPAEGPLNQRTIANAVEAICPAIELVDDRDADYGALDVRSLVADNSWNGGAVLGAFHPPEHDLEAICGIVECDGTLIDQGHGRDVLGHPFAPLVWLANHLAARGECLRKGDIVLTGSLCPTRFPAFGEHYRYTLNGVGSVSIKIGS